MKVKDSNIFPMDQMNINWHLATIIDGNHEYVIFTCLRGKNKGKVYIEEAVATTIDFTQDVFANLKFISDQNIVREIVEFANTKNLLDIAGRFEQMTHTEQMRKMLLGNEIK